MEIDTEVVYHIGIDEVGRGPVAGPVVVCACAKQDGVEVLHLFPKGELRDSKKISKKKREEIVEALQEYSRDKRIVFGLGSVDAATIDTLGISEAIREATRIALRSLVQQGVSLNTKIALDGSLYLDDGYDYETIIKGDEKIEEIALASIHAKVYRDRYMEELSKKYPEYGFEKHAGYGTSFHLKMITQYGLSEIHRKSFLSKFK
jgi:ribonuclease HII